MFLGLGITLNNLIVLPQGWFFDILIVDIFTLDSATDGILNTNILG